ncbi:MAG: vitamin K epoxide reductase [Clostridia bacterium]|nr:MAG: vitamin K epoxide reductase [Clostridia bacterium]
MYNNRESHAVFVKGVVMRRIALFVLFLLLLAAAGLPLVVRAQDAPVVRAVLFYSPTCPHCHKVIQEDLPPIVKKYGDQLQILLINVTTEGGQELYQSAAKSVPIPDNMRGVPALVIGKTLLVGDKDIPAQLPGIVEQGLASGGIDWPAIPGLDRVLAEMTAREAAQQTPTVTAESKTATETAATTPNVTPASPAENKSDAGASLNEVDVKAISEMSIAERLGLDPTGSAIAIVTLVAMLAMLLWAVMYWVRSGFSFTSGPSWLNWALPVLAIVGAGVAFYLAFIETTGSEAVCGPVGDCNAVQQSSYAMLFGVLPVGVLGLLGYLVILALWAWQYLSNASLSEKIGWMLPAITFFGVVFSAYLTFLEPFVIGAICMWCMTSAWIMTILLFLTFRWTIPSRKSGSS